MASVEPYFTSSGAARYKGIPWDAVNQKKGPTKSFHYESDALAYAKAWEKDRDGFAESIGLDPERNHSRVTVAEYARKYVARKAGPPSTQRDRASIANRIAERWPTLRIREMDRGAIMDYLEHLQSDGGRDGKPMAPGTIRRRITFLNGMFNEAVLDGLITESPCRSLPSMSRVTLREHYIPTEGELKLIIESMPDWMEVAILLAHDSGLRQAEVCGLRWCRIDFENEDVTVKDVLEKDGTLRHFPKGKEARVVPLSARTIAALKRVRLRQRNAGPDDFVLQRPRGAMWGPMTPHQLAAWWSRAVRKVEDIRGYPAFHDLRHACAWRLARLMDIQDLKEFMGHKSIETTAIYMPKGSMNRMRKALDMAPTFRDDATVIEMRSAR